MPFTHPTPPPPRLQAKDITDIFNNIIIHFISLYHFNQPDLKNNYFVIKLSYSLILRLNHFP